ncbi:MAG: TylF/MycF/NovP-related O-methyltransferase [Fuerstiella sp.]|jgi:hypothetical protein|nr:TylF/MycF/NovP-related O-methyltransferase [Fuerstiella sp.]
MTPDQNPLRVDPSVMPDHVVDARLQLCRELQDSPLPPHELIRNLGLYLLPMELKRFMFFADLYQQFLHVPGVILEFGTRWGQNLATLQSLRSVLEPYHHRRKILGFDTFKGFPDVTNEDGSDAAATPGAYAVTEDYDQYLKKIMQLREMQSPLPDVCKFEIIRGDVSQTLPEYLEQHPETIVAFAYFDLDLYQPTRDCLKLLSSRLTKGSVVGFDELNHAAFPGETVAVHEALGLNNIQLRRSPWSADESYFVV